MSLLGISRPTLARLLRRGELPVVKVAGRTLIDPSDLRSFIEERKVRRLSNDDDQAGTRSIASTSAGAGGGDGSA